VSGTSGHARLAATSLKLLSICAGPLEVVRCRIGSTTGLDEDEVVYRCHHCGAEVVRIFELHRSASEG